MDFILKNIEKVIVIPQIANVHFFEFSKGYETQNDRHPFCELVFTINGSATITAENYCGKLRKNELIIHQANEMHSLKCKKNKKNSLLIIGFVCKAEYLKAFSQRPILLDESEAKELAQIIKEGRNVFAPPYNKPLKDMKKKQEQVFGCEQLLVALLENFLIGLIRKHDILLRLRACDNPAKREDFLIEEVLDYINAHFTEKITLSEISFMFGTNRSSFCRSFKAYTGKTFIEYLSDKKLEKAKQLLSTTNKTAAQIADELNFESPAYFNRFFKKHTGATPKHFREN